MRTDLRFTHLTLVPGRPTHVAIEVTNTSDVIDGVTAIIDGLDEDWIRFDEPLVRLFPDASGEVSFTIEVPERCPAGDYLVIVRIVSTISADRQSVQDFWATVEPRRAGRLDVVPRIVTKRSKAELNTTVANLGNTPTTYRLEAVDATGEVDCHVDPAEVLVGLDEEAHAVVRLRGPRPWFGQVESRSIMLTARAEDVELSAIATFNQKPRISRGLITFLTLLAIVALWVTMFVFVIGYLRNTEQPDKAAATAIAGGEKSVPIGEIAAQMSGTVTSSTQNQGVPRIAVQALRIPADAAPELFAEAATDDDGTFLFSTLLPGDYLLKFSGAGFDTVWYPGVPSQDDARVIPLDPAGEEDDLNVTLVGASGAFRGLIGTPGADVVVGNFAITATLLDGEGSVVDGAEPLPGTYEPADGTYALGDLPAPNDYLVQIKDLDGNYSDQEFVISIAAGETKQLNPVVPTAATGELSGFVRNGAGDRLGGVTVTVRNGEFETEAVTPTAGDTGSFRFIGLPTPATYIVTFALEGHTGETISLPLGPGGSDDTLRPVLVGGQGTVNGIVTDTDGNPLGAAMITIEGSGFSAATASLTDPGSTGGVGSFYLTAIPIPGNYTITVDLEGYESVTVPASFDASGTRLAPQVRLDPIAGSVVGIVTSSLAGPIDNVTVRLSNGLDAETRSTVSLSDPLGRFSFAGVEPGAYTVRFSAVDHKNYVLLIDVPSGSEAAADVTLTYLPQREEFVASPELAIEQSVDQTVLDAPGTLTYTITVTNTGNLSLTAIEVTNDLADGLSGPIDDVDDDLVLRVGEEWTFTATYDVTQAVIDAGVELVNVARVVARERPVATDSDPLTTTITQNPEATLGFAVSPTTYSGSGTLTYTTTVLNDGNVSLTGVDVSVLVAPDSFALAPVLIAGDANSNAVLDVDETWVYSASYTLREDDFVAAGVTATASMVSNEITTPIEGTDTSTNGSAP